MRVLFIGGTGLISSACSDATVAAGHELWLLNRGRSKLATIVANERVLTADANHESALAAAVKGHDFDVVVQWVGYEPSQVERDSALRGCPAIRIHQLGFGVRETPFALGDHRVDTNGEPILAVLA